MKIFQIISCILVNILCLSRAVSGQVTLFEDLLYWHASQQPTSTWAYVQTINSPPGAVYTEPNVYFGWSPGLRLGIQNEPSAFFDAKLYWTYFSTKTQTSITAAPNAFILPEFFSGFTTVTPFNAAQLNWKLIMNTIDGEVGHTFYPIDTLTLRPFIGIKGGTINQSIHSSWQENLFGLTIYTAQENLKHNFLGLGPSIGIDSEWALYKTVSLRSDFSAAILWGHWNINDTFHKPAAFLGLIPEKTVFSNTNNSMLGTLMAKYFLGLAWNIPSKTSVTIKAGYEMQFWSNQLRLPVFQALPIHGDLTLQGATCGIIIKL